jgi:hypothetical protein
MENKLICRGRGIIVGVEKKIFSNDLVECGSNGLLRKENFTSSSPAPLNFSSHPDNFGKYFLKLNKGKKVVFMLKKNF